MVTNPVYHYMRNDEFMRYAQEVLQHIQPVDIPPFMQLEEELREIIDVHQASMIGKPANFYTEILKEADRQRESAFMALRDYIKACNRRLKIDWRGPSQHLIQVFRIYGWNLYTTDYIKQSKTIALLIHELNDGDENFRALEALNAVEWLRELEEVNQQFNILLNERNKSLPPKPVTKTKETRLQLRNKCKEIVLAAEKEALLNPGLHCDELVENLSLAAQSINQVVKQRMQASKKRKGAKWEG